ncbi:MAG: glycosyltransferase, partial [Scytonema sp. PMC 1069.18]|nr:glycosyltransferase [Scytonema sp. PMC 1069.18]
KMGLPLQIYIISALKHGLGVPTDFPDQTKYEDDLKLLDLDNVVYHSSLPNDKVLELLLQSDFHLLATLHDTYGYSVTESLSLGTPVISTNVCALPESVRHGDNGYVLQLELNKLRHWKNWLHEELNTDKYWDILNNTYEYLANQALQLIMEFFERTDRGEHYESLSAGALAQALNFNNAEKQNQLFDQLYAEVAGVK